MPTITLRNVPAELHRRLKERAARNRRSLNREAIHCLEAALHDPAHGDDTEAVLERIRRRRAALSAQGVWLTEEAVAQAIQEGREERLP